MTNCFESKPEAFRLIGGFPPESTDEILRPGVLFSNGLFLGIGDPYVTDGMASRVRALQ